MSEEVKNNRDYQIIANGEFLCLFREEGNVMYKRFTMEDVIEQIEGDINDR